MRVVRFPQLCLPWCAAKDDNFHKIINLYTCTRIKLHILRLHYNARVIYPMATEQRNNMCRTSGMK